MSKALTLDRVIDAFIDGRTEFPEFRQVVEDQLARHPESATAALKRLESLKRTGRLSPALHAVMAEEISRSSKGDITAPIDEPGPRPPAPRGPDSKPRPEPSPEPRPEPSPEPSRTPERKPPPVLTTSARKPARKIEAPSPPQVGNVLAERYQLEALLERGGMSQVFRAADLRRRGRGAEPAKVGVKLVHAGTAGRVALESLEREASLLAELNHPGVVRTLDFDQEGDCAFMVMELLSGERLRSRLVRSHPAPLPRDEAMRVIRQLAEALAYLHGRRLVHRDVKPANIFITASGEVRLIDFGLAAAAARSGGLGAPGKPEGTAAKAWTPLYASPEMLGGAPPDPRDDVYSLGCVAYEVLTGRHPWGNLPGDQAARKKLKASHPAGLAGPQWKALRRALALKGRERPADAAAFLAEFFPPARPRRVLPWVAVALLGGVAAGVALSSLGPGLPIARTPWTTPPQAPPQDGDTARAPAGATDRGAAEEQGAAEEDGAAAEQDTAAEQGTGEDEPVAEELEPVAEQVEPPAATGPAEDEARAEPAPEASADPEPPPATPGPVGPPELAFSAGSFRVGENAGALRLELLRPEGYAGPLRALWRTVNQTGRDGVDFAGSPSWQWIGAAEDAPSLVILIPIVDDSLAGPDVTFLVELREVSDGPPVGAPARAEITIVDDD
jgi:serine/threonine protein kinase